MRVLVSGSGWRCFAAATSVGTALAVSACGATSRNPHGEAAGGTAGTAGATSAGSGGMAVELEAVPAYMRRLSPTEYVATVRDVLGVQIEAHLPEPVTVQGFDNNGEAVGVTAVDFEGFLAGADEATEMVLAEPKLAPRIVVCEDADNTACVQRIVTEVGLRVFRRPLLSEEIPVYEKVYTTARANGEEHTEAARLVALALLSSAQFLFRMELESGQKGQRDLNGYELATRLSYLLWSSAPDEALLRAAEDDTMTDDAGLAAQLERLWADPRFDRFDHDFGAQWLELRRLAGVSRDATKHPEWSPEVAQAAANEGIESFRTFSHEDRPFPAFLSGQPHPISSLLAPLYGIAPSPDPTQGVLLDDPTRIGFLTSVAFSALTSSSSSRTSPTYRGRFILEQLLCSPTPPPPPDVDIIPPQEPPPETTREALEYYWKQPSCKDCHLQLDPLGLPFESYDPIGRYRESYENGIPIDTAVHLPASETQPQEVAIEGPADVVAFIQGDPRLLACFTRQLYAFGMGRLVRDPDRSNIDRLNESWQQGALTVKGALKTLVMSETFRTRLDGAEQELP